MKNDIFTVLFIDTKVIMESSNALHETSSPSSSASPSSKKHDMTKDELSRLLDACNKYSAEHPANPGAYRHNKRKYYSNQDVSNTDPPSQSFGRKNSPNDASKESLAVVPFGLYPRPSAKPAEYWAAHAVEADNDQWIKYDPEKETLDEYIQQYKPSVMKRYENSHYC